MQIDNWHFTVLTIDVLFEHFALRKRFVAFRARIWPFTGMNHFVALENLLLDECSPAFSAFEWFFTGVSAMVANERAFTGKPFATIFTHVSTAIDVRRDVSSELDTSGKCFGTAIALEYLHFTVFVQVDGFHVVELTNRHSVIVGNFDLDGYVCVTIFADSILVVGLHPETSIRFDCFLREINKYPFRLERMNLNINVYP